jgi:hypothetical protein
LKNLQKEKMADEKQVDFSDIQIVGGVATWEMRTEGSISGTYTGTFKFRCYLSPLQKIAAGREQRELLGESRAWVETPDYEHESFLAYALTQLKYRVLSAPPFWTSAGINKTHEGDIPDEDVIEKILDAAVRSELKYKRDLQSRKDEALKRANEGAKILQEQQKNEEPAETLETLDDNPE